ncbi:Protein of unknown function [Pyronema omphalodes CBS 100304]|uniref:Uncharacterized protein n=1 Tax=Pyronema omphalodes (strain CBS 100304) TaxID=1076935 RepID=U4LMC1_PYROM|nr:Protein of unknown function [Pyronema omphalodes CBS 100304]
MSDANPDPYFQNEPEAVKVVDGKTSGLGRKIASYNSALCLLKRWLNTRFNQSGVRKAEAVARHDTFQSEPLENKTSHNFEALLKKYPNLGNAVIELKRIQSVLIAREHIDKRYDGLVVYAQHPRDGETYSKMVAEYNAGIWYLIFRTMAKTQAKNAEKNDPYDVDLSDVNSINTQNLMSNWFLHADVGDGDDDAVIGRPTELQLSD